MKKLLLIVGFVAFQHLVNQQQVLAQSCSQKATAEQVEQMEALKGTWRGTLETGSDKKPLTFVISEQNGQLVASISYGSPTQKGMLAQASLCSPGKFHFFGELLSGEDFRYNAFLKNGRLEGSYSTGNTCSKDAQQAFNLSK